MLRLLRQRPGRAPWSSLAHFVGDAIAGEGHAGNRARFAGALTALTANLTRSCKSSPYAKGTGLKSSLTLHLLFMVRPAP
jgi:hypothetical protein